MLTTIVVLGNINPKQVTGVEPARRLYESLMLPITLHLQIGRGRESCTHRKTAHETAEPLWLHARYTPGGI